MGMPVVNGAQIACSYGAAPASLVVAPTGRVNIEGQPAATIIDHVPNTNIPPFGMCSSLANPQVAAATAAAQGTLTPQPCVPFTTLPWTPGAPMSAVGGNVLITEASTCVCNWAGSISVVTPGSIKTQVA